MRTMLRQIPRPPWLSESVWPFETFGLGSDDCLLAVTDTGRGPTLLFVHVAAWSLVWRDLVKQLAPDFRCVFFDAPGSGLSQRGAEAPSLRAASSAVRSVIEQLDLREFTLVTHDLGGPPALAAVGPLAQRVRGMVAMNSFGWRPEGLVLRGMLCLIGSRPISAIDEQFGLISRLSSTSFGVGRHFDEASRKAFRAGMGREGRRAFHDYMRSAARGDDLFREAERALAGPLAEVPLLTVFGERNDPFGFQKQWKSLFPEARQAVVAQGNHFPMCDAPEFAAVAIGAWYRECVDG